VVLGLVAGVIVGAVVAVVVEIAVAVVAERSAAGRVLRLLGGAPVDEDDEPSLANLVEGLCATFGVARPELWLVEDPVPNACTIGRPKGKNVLVVTAGLLDGLGLIEMEGVVAHELAHVKRGEPVAATAAVAVVGALVRMTGNDRLVHAALGVGREYQADQLAALTVRYPPGLGEALEVLQRGPAPAAGSVFSGRRWAMTRWLWIDPMVGRRDGPLQGELDATAVRRSALAEW
jgi:heat shock protein HtpX